MKIGIIANPIDDIKTGIGSYTYNVLIELFKIEYKKNSDNRYTIIHRKKCEHLNILLNKYNFLSEIIIPVPKIPLGHEIQKMIITPHVLKKHDFDIIHDVYHFGPFLSLKKPKKILTVYDITPLLYPKTHKKSKVLMHRYYFPLVLKKSDKIISISHHTKQDLIKHFKISEDKIKVIHLAANENYKPLKENEINKILDETEGFVARNSLRSFLKQKYNLNYPFILYVGTLEPRKNIPTLLKALYKLKKQGIKHKLVITGKKGWKYKSIFETIEKLNLQKDVIFTGYVPDEDLPALYNAAVLFVYPSLYEGFGLPPLEAMACGTPVITSNTSSLPEVVGDAGIMVNPYDVDELANKMYEVLTNDGLREELSKKGLERAKLFSWKKCAEETLKVYEEVYNMK
ncbi:glycosyltransferase family 1 protein [Methanothermococcus sp.]|uniref:glycosyltransferase family 4 protein n=1 Tax=Methanothermococcus sp. TaxID=2614238 RepID=UPI0025D1BABF|nr:glycosyltransferase family 1 protein [Methanothermococcus sp.]